LEDFGILNYEILENVFLKNQNDCSPWQVPTCCTCHVQGYYIPSQQSGGPQSPAPNRPPPAGGHGPPGPPGPRRRLMMMRPPLRPRHELLPHPQQQQHNNQSPPPDSNKADDLDELLKQYALLRDKIAKKKGNFNTLFVENDLTSFIQY
jgi:hypothetical protein